MFKWPKSNAAFWRKKMTGNRKRDERHTAELLVMGWRVITVWECALRGRNAHDVDRLLKKISSWLHSKASHLEFSGKIAR